MSVHKFKVGDTYFLRTRLTCPAEVCRHPATARAQRRVRISDKECSGAARPGGSREPAKRGVTLCLWLCARVASEQNRNCPATDCVGLFVSAFVREQVKGLTINREPPGRSARPTTRRSPRRSAFVFAPVVAYLAEFPRALDKPTLSPRAFLVGRGLIAEAVDFLACHLGGFAPASFVTLTRDNAASKTAALRQPLNCHRPRRTISLFAAPLIYALQKCRAERNRYSI